MTPTATQPVIVRYKGAKKVFADAKGSLTAVEDVTLDIHEGEFVSFVGRSGCGKTTLLKMTAGLLEGTDGTIEVQGEAVRGPVPGLGMMFQTPVLLDWRDVIGNIMLPIEFLHQDRATGMELAHTLIKMVGLEGFEGHKPRQLSGGMQQRVAICRALVAEPSLMLMDEPFAALDALTRDDMATELLRVQDATKKTIIFVTHNIEEAVLLSDRVVVFQPRPGRVRMIETIDLPRPRSMEMRYDERFLEHARYIRDAIYAT